MRNSLISGSLGLVVGFLMAFLLLKKGSSIEPGSKSAATPESKDLISVNPNVDYFDFTPQQDSSKGGQRITNEDAITMVNEFKKESDKVWYPLRTQDGKNNLQGFFVKWQIFDTLIRQNGCNGIRFYLAKRPGLPKRRGYTLVIVGTKADPNDIYKDLNGNVDDTNGGYYEEIDPCPNNCGSTVTNPTPLSNKLKK